MSTAAQDEFNQLVSSKETVSHHPEDAAGDADSETLVDEKADKVSSVKDGKYDEGDSSDADSDAYPASRRKPATYTLPKSYTYNSNTGPKGVIADAQAFELEKSVGNKRTYLRTEDFVLPKNQRLATQGTENRSATQSSENATNNNEDDDEDDEDEDEMLRKWRERRVGELQREMLKRKSVESRGRYGTVKAVDAMGFLDAVEKVPNETVVVVFVYDDELPLSDAYQTHVCSLAAKYTQIKFVALHYEEAEMEHAGVPAILAYKNGEQFARLVPLEGEVSFANDVEVNFEEAFRRHQIL